ncbi:hypothetical protein D5086_010712 [Populus alba]|uniref:Uncharacterized protein n=1 Tax=Populus alba TaxID=43335 RepID=A0ACC4CA52_POPAL
MEIGPQLVRQTGYWCFLEVKQGPGTSNQQAPMRFMTILHYQSLNLKMRENEFKSEEGDKELHLTNKENVEGNILQESCLKRSGQDDAEIMGNDKHVDTAGALESSPNLKKCACAIEPDPDSNGKDYDGGVEKVMAKMLQSSPKS